MYMLYANLIIGFDVLANFLIRSLSDDDNSFSSILNAQN